MFEITQDITGISVGLWYVHVTGDRVAGSVSGQPCLTTGGGSGSGHHHQDKSARHLTLITR